MSIKVLLVDDHPIVIAGFAKLLEEDDRFDVVQLVSSGSAAISYVQQNSIDVAVVDINMEEIDGLKTTSRLKALQPDIKVIMLSVNEVEPFISKSFEAGAKGFLSKRCAPDELPKAIVAVCRGERFLSDGIYRQVAMDRLDNKENVLKSLTKREFEVFRYLVNGDTMNDIADKLHISPKTGYAFRGNVFKKLGVSTIVELVRVAQRHKII